jgi:type II secretory pathway pseudopilin PulG
MNALEIILVVLALLVVVLGGGGYIAMARRTSARDHRLLEQLTRAERDLAQARASDKGWDRATLESAARAAAAERFGSAAAVTGLQLVRVIDKPGTDADEAVFRVETADGEHSITLGRRGGVWGTAGTA